MRAKIKSLHKDLRGLLLRKDAVRQNTFALTVERVVAVRFSMASARIPSQLLTSFDCKQGAIRAARFNGKPLQCRG